MLDKKESFNRIMLKEFYEMEKRHRDEKDKFIKNYSIKKIRKNNIPESLSENIIKFIIIDIEKNNTIKWSSCSGDLLDGNNIIECKCFSSSGPISFSPTPKWKYIYFLDARLLFITGYIKLYKCYLPPESKQWQNIKINKLQTFSDQIKQKRRPRITWKELEKQIEYEEIFSDNINKLF